MAGSWVCSGMVFLLFSLCIYKQLNMPSESTAGDRSLGEKYIARFLHYFPAGFNDPKYIETERKDKWKAHLLWQKNLSRSQYTDLLNKGQYMQISSEAVRIASKPELLTSFEKKVLRDAVKSEGGARIFAIGLYNYLYGQGTPHHHFNTLTRVLETLPHKQVSVLTWPAQTVFGFIAKPVKHFFVVPEIVTVAKRYGFDFCYRHRPDWDTYRSVLAFAAQVLKDIKHLKPHDVIDLQSFISVLGSKIYPEFPDEAG
jgi:hypothetical protein